LSIGLKIPNVGLFVFYFPPTSPYTLKPPFAVFANYHSTLRQTTHIWLHFFLYFSVLPGWYISCSISGREVSTALKPGFQSWKKVLLLRLCERPPVALVSLFSYLLLAWSSTPQKKQKTSATYIHGKLDLALEKVETE